MSIRKASEKYDDPVFLADCAQPAGEFRRPAQLQHRCPKQRRGLGRSALVAASGSARFAAGKAVRGLTRVGWPQCMR